MGVVACMFEQSILELFNTHRSSDYIGSFICPLTNSFLLYTNCFVCPYNAEQSTFGSYTLCSFGRDLNLPRLNGCYSCVVNRD